jgi:predicted metal-dependent hydrolase
MNDIPIRIMQFDFDAKALKQSIPDMLDGLGLSMTLPYLEPYLIRTMREALKHATDEDVINEVKLFIGQEAQHFRQHRKLNDLLRSCHPELAGLQDIEDQMEADYQRFTKTKSLQFNLAYAEGFEAATCAVARTALEATDIHAPMSDISRLFVWHLAEEIEHRTVTFNIYDHLYGGYFYRLFVGIYGQYHFFKYVYKFARFIGQHQPPRDPEASPEPLASVPERKLKPALALAGRWLATYLPWYNPANVRLPKTHREMTAALSEAALETRGVN